MGRTHPVQDSSRPEFNDVEKPEYNPIGQPLSIIRRPSTLNRLYTLVRWTKDLAPHLPPKRKNEVGNGEGFYQGRQIRPDWRGFVHPY